MIDIIWDYGANAPDWGAVVSAIAVAFTTGVLIWYLRQRRIDQRNRRLRDREELLHRMQSRARDLERELHAARSENLELQSAYLKLQTDHLRRQIIWTAHRRNSRRNGHIGTAGSQ